MIAFSDLDRYMMETLDPQHWGDVGVLHAVDLLNELSPEEFKKLTQAWQHRSEEWQFRCADILADGEPGKVIPVLLSMILEGSDELAVDAADSLRARLGGRPLPLEVPRAIFDRVERLAAKHGGLVRDSMHTLLGRLRAS